LERIVHGYKSLGVEPETDESIRAFMKKPQHLTTIQWSTASLANAQLYNVWSRTIINSDVFARKWHGFRNVRGTLVLRVTINAQPFNAGRLLLHFIPIANQLGAAHTESMHNHNLATKTQQPHVEIDCRDSAATLRIPYIAPTQWYDTESEVGEWGYAYLSVLSPLTTGSGGPTLADVSIFAHFEDFEVATPLYPQSGEAPGRTRVKKVSFNKEKSEMSTGAISGALDAVSRVATTVSGVPLLSDIAGPVSWITRMGSDVASAFGWSKPNFDVANTPIVVRPFRSMPNAEGATSAEPLSLSSAPSVKVQPGFAGTDLDEMSFDYLKAIPSYVSSFTFATTDNAGDALLDTQVGPSHSHITENSGGVNVSHYITGPPFAILSRCFSHFRGGIRLHLKIIKTDFHSGRLCVTFTPNISAATAPTIDQSSYALREIIDIRETSEVIIDMPYLLYKTYAETVNGVIGKLNIRVLNELKCPLTVAQSVEVLSFYSACDDFELSAPIPHKMMPFRPQSGDRLRPQGADEPDNYNEHTLVVSKSIGNSSIPSFDTSNVAYCVGEAFTSVKQLATRYSRLRMAAASDIAFTDYFGMYVNGIGAASRADLAILPSANYFGDMWSLLSSGYAMSRGGMRYLFSDKSASRVALTYYYNLIGTTYITLASPTNSGSLSLSNSPNPGQFNSTGAPMVYNNIQDGVEIEVPMYSDSPSRPNFVATAAGDHVISYGSPGVSRLWLEYQADTAPTALQVYRCASDDAQLGYFYGFPPMLINHV